jgi:hypothetical protein
LLPEELRAQLADSGAKILSHTGYLAEITAIDIAVRVVEQGVIENIEELSPDFKRDGLGNPGSLGKPQIGVVQSWAVKELATGISELAERTRCKCTGHEEASLVV